MPQAIEHFREQFRDAVERGAKLLDEIKPGWANLIQEDKLNMNEPKECIAGQLGVEDYKNIAETDSLAFSANYGFNPWKFDLPFGWDEEHISEETIAIWMVEIVKRR